MNEDSQRLLDATRDALTLQRVIPTIGSDPERIAKIAIVAILRELRIMINGHELDALGGDDADEGWPDADDLLLLANDVEASL